MGLRPDELLGSAAAPHEFHLNTVAEEVFAPGAPWPTVQVLRAEVVPVRRLVHQTLLLRAERPDDPDAPAQTVALGRLVAELESGAEIEIMRDALPADADDPAVDLSRCAACGGAICAGEAVVDDGSAYHPACWQE